MNIPRIMDDVFADLRAVAKAAPNERLPKEEQIRARIFASIRQEFDVVCAEKGYASINRGSRIESDLWARKKGEPDTWIEFKRCWFGTGWTNKPSEQIKTWSFDLKKLAAAKPSSHRYFFLFGFFDFDPCRSDCATKGLVRAIYDIEPGVLDHAACEQFRWPNGEGVTHMAAWCWHWRPGVRVGVLPQSRLRRSAADGRSRVNAKSFD
jgi:hypothetical protein